MTIATKLVSCRGALISVQKWIRKVDKILTAARSDAEFLNLIFKEKVTWRLRLVSN
jgi:hypothetical protein